MLQRELTYQVSFERLARLSRSASRKAFPALWGLTFLLLALFGAAMLGLFFYGNLLGMRLEDAGAPFGLELLFLAVCLLFVFGALLLRTLRTRQLKGRASFGQSIRLTQDEGGLRFATPEIEHYLKWPGISQMLVEHDGVVLSHGALFYLVPDNAFSGAAERLAFVRDVYGRLGESARAISERHVRAALADGGQQ